MTGIPLSKLVRATPWLDDNLVETEPPLSHADGLISQAAFRDELRSSAWIVEGYRPGSGALVRLPPEWADLPVCWDILNDAASWNGIRLGYLSARRATIDPPAGERGPPATKKSVVEARMRTWLEKEARTTADLKLLKKKQLPKMFGGEEDAGVTTCQNARKAVIESLTVA